MVCIFFLVLQNFSILKYDNLGRFYVNVALELAIVHMVRNYVRDLKLIKGTVSELL